VGGVLDRRSLQRRVVTQPVGGAAVKGRKGRVGRTGAEAVA
jgi:hypothetical protein